MFRFLQDCCEIIKKYAIDFFFLEAICIFAYIFLVVILNVILFEAKILFKMGIMTVLYK